MSLGQATFRGRPLSLGQLQGLLSELVGGKLERVFDDQRAALSVVWRLGRETFSSSEKERGAVLMESLHIFKGIVVFPGLSGVSACPVNQPFLIIDVGDILRDYASTTNLDP